MEQLFKQYGEVESIRLLPEEGSALVNLTSVQNAVSAKQSLDGANLGGGNNAWTLRVSFVRPQPMQQPRNTLM